MIVADAAGGTCAFAADTLAAHARKRPVVNASTRRWSTRVWLDDMNRSGDREAVIGDRRKEGTAGPTDEKNLRAGQRNGKGTY